MNDSAIILYAADIAAHSSGTVSYVGEHRRRIMKFDLLRGQLEVDLLYVCTIKHSFKEE